MSEKIETDAIEEAVETYIDTLQRRIHNHQGVIGECAACRNAERSIASTRAQLARLKAAAALLRSYRAACGEHASTMVLVHRDEIDGVLGEVGRG